VSDFESGWRRLVRGETKEWWAGPARAGLGVLSGLYGGGVSTYRAGFDAKLLRTTRVPCRVVSVGNITVGGTGKTTTVRWLVRKLQELGAAPAVLSYGYRSDAEDPVTVVADREGIRAPVELTGDEPQLLARSLPGVPVLAGPRRVLSARRSSPRRCGRRTA
jgi:tetraacyldisaccharide 4'-kinase